MICVRLMKIKCRHIYRYTVPGNGVKNAMSQWDTSKVFVWLLRLKENSTKLLTHLIDCVRAASINQAVMLKYWLNDFIRRYDDYKQLKSDFNWSWWYLISFWINVEVCFDHFHHCLLFCTIVLVLLHLSTHSTIYVSMPTLWWLLLIICVDLYSCWPMCFATFLPLWFLCINS